MKTKLNVMPGPTRHPGWRGALLHAPDRLRVLAPGMLACAVVGAAAAFLLLVVTTTLPLIYLMWASTQRMDLSLPGVGGFAGLHGPGDDVPRRTVTFDVRQQRQRELFGAAGSQSFEVEIVLDRRRRREAAP